MPKIDLTTAANLQDEASFVSAYNANLVLIEEALDDVLFREGDGAASANAMIVDLDMNSKKILNLPEPASDLEPVRKVDLGTYLADAETAATAAQTAQTAAETAQTAAETAKTGAETAQTAAELAETNAETAETNAAASAAAAAVSAAEAEAAVDLELAGITDVTLTSVQDGDVLTYDSGTAEWVNEAASGGGGGKVAQVVNTQTGAVVSGTTVIPIDNTIPQNTEGVEMLTLAITPTDASSTLIIEANVMMDHTSGTHFLIATLFQDSTADALAIAVNSQQAAQQPAQVVLRYVMTAGTTSATTFKIRGGSNASGTIRMNRPLWNSLIASSLTITEILP